MFAGEHSARMGWRDESQGLLCSRPTLSSCGPTQSPPHTATLLRQYSPYLLTESNSIFTPFTTSITMENMRPRTEISFDFALVTEEYSRKTRHGDRGVGMGVGSMDTLKGYWSRPWKRQIPPVKMKGEGLKGERKQVGSFRRKRCFVPSTSGVGFDPRRCQAALEDHRRFSSSPAPLCRHQRSKHDA